MRGIHLVFSSSFGLLWLLTKASGLQQDWFNCSAVSSCNATLQAHPCSVLGGECQCGVPSNGSSTCAMQPSVLVNQTGAPLNTTRGPLSCCLCPSNSTMCCQTCNSTTTPSPLASTTTAAIQPRNYAQVIAAFVVDCTSYDTTLMGRLFQQAIVNQTSMTALSDIDIKHVTCVSGYQPFCGVDTSIAGSAHHRARRLAVGGRSRAGSANNNKKQSSNGVSFSYNSPQTYVTEELKIPCKSLTINATLWEDPLSGISLERTLEVLQELVLNGTLVVRLGDSAVIKATFAISGMRNTSFVLHLSPYMYKAPVPTTKPVPPLETNLKPLIYTGSAIVGLIFLCVAYQFVKQSWLLRRKKFTDINSDRVNSRKQRVMQVMESQEEKEEERNEFDMTYNSLPRVTNEALTRRYDWTAPGYLPSMLAPAYKPTEYHGQQSPPRLILDDGDSDEEKNSLGKASVVNIDDETDEDLRDILESDEEYERPASKRSNRSTRNPSTPDSNIRKTRKPSAVSKNTRKSSAASTAKPRTKSNDKVSTQPLPGRQRKCSYMDPDGGRDILKGQKSPTPSIRNLKQNRITPVGGDRKPSVSSLKPQKHVDQSNC